MIARPHIFLSFKTEERDSAARLNDALAAAGYKVWWQEDIQCGKAWHADIDLALSGAGCVVVLWSAAAMGSPWVRHEASQAMARENYAPVRIDASAIESPYDHIQASNLVDWSGRADHPGFAGLVRRIEELMPSRRATAGRFWQRNRWTIASICFAAAAVALLVRLSTGLDNQLNAQAAIAKEIQRTLQPLDGFELSAYVTLPPTIPEVPEYLRLLQRSLGRTESGKYVFNSELPTGVYASVKGANGEVKAVAIQFKAPLWPTSPEFGTLAALVDLAGLKVSFTRKPGADATSSSKQDEDATSADLSFDVGAYDPDGSERQQPRPPTLNWNIEEDRLTLQFTDSPARRYWKSNGKIVSVPDLADSTIQVGIDSTMYRSPINPEALLQGRRRFELETLFLDYSGRKVMIRTSDMSRKPDERGLMTYTGVVSVVAKPM